MHIWYIPIIYLKLIFDFWYFSIFDKAFENSEIGRRLLDSSYDFK